MCVRRVARSLVVLALVAAALVVGEMPTAEASVPLYLPYAAGSSYRVSQGNNGSYSHNGTYGRYAVDFVMPENTGVVASASGTIVRAMDGCPVTPSNGCNGGLGNYLVVQHSPGFCTQYAHLRSFVRSSGQVARGEVIGRSGNSGWSTGPHLDFRRTACNTISQPFAFVEYNGSYEHSVILNKVLTSQNGSGPSGDPFGSIDSVRSSPGVVAVRGWAADPNEPTRSIAVHVYIGGPAGTAGAEGHALTANVSRPDVGAALPGYGSAHGYDHSLTTAKRGSQNVCIYAINVGAGSNKLLGCRTVSIGSPEPFGHLDSVTGGPGTVRVGGWSADPNAPTQSTRIHVYVGGPAGTKGAEGHSFRAAVERPDVVKAHTGYSSRRGFLTTLTTAKRGPTRVCAYAINIGPGSNQLLGCRDVTITNPDPVGAFQSVTSAGGKVRVRGWAADPNAGTRATQVQVSIGGKLGAAGTQRQMLTAARPWTLPASMRQAYGPNHGFDTEVATDRRGRTEVCLYAENVGPGVRRLLGCAIVNIVK